MKIVLQVVALLVAVIALYALPEPSAQDCPVGDEWSCVQFLADDADSSGLDGDAELIELLASKADDAESGEPAGEDADASNDIELSSNGVLIVDTDDADYEDELLSGTKWSAQLLAIAADARVVAVTFEADEIHEVAPRILESPPTRLQIIDVGGQEVVFDDELPQETDWMEWLSDNRLVVGGDNGAITVFAAN